MILSRGEYDSSPYLFLYKTKVKFVLNTGSSLTPVKPVRVSPTLWMIPVTRLWTPASRGCHPFSLMSSSGVTKLYIFASPGH